MRNKKTLLWARYIVTTTCTGSLRHSCETKGHWTQPLYPVSLYCVRTHEHRLPIVNIYLTFTHTQKNTFGLWDQQAQDVTTHLSTREGLTVEKQNVGNFVRAFRAIRIRRIPTSTVHNQEAAASCYNQVYKPYSSQQGQSTHVPPPHGHTCSEN